MEEHYFKIVPSTLVAEVFAPATPVVTRHYDVRKGERFSCCVTGLSAGFMWDGCKWILDFVSTASLPHGSLSVYYREKRGTRRIRISDHWSGRNAGQLRNSMDYLQGDDIPVDFHGMSMLGGVEG